MTDQSAGPIARGMKTAFKMEPNEIKATLLSFLFIFTLMASYYILRPIRDAMSSDWSDAELSTLFTFTFLGSIVAVTIYGAVFSRVKVSKFVPGIYGLFAASFLGFYFATQGATDADFVRKSFYVWISLFSLFHVSVFWSFMADIFTKDQAPRLFGFIAAGSSLGAIFGPTIALFTVDIVGSENLILISAVLLLDSDGDYRLVGEIKAF